MTSELSPSWRVVMRFLAREIAWRSILGSVPKLAVLFGQSELEYLLRQPFDPADLTVGDRRRRT